MMKVKVVVQVSDESKSGCEILWKWKWLSAPVQKSHLPRPRDQRPATGPRQLTSDQLGGVTEYLYQFERTQPCNLPTVSLIWVLHIGNTFIEKVDLNLETFFETWCASCTILVTVLLLTGPASKWSWWGMTTHFCERFVWYANIKNHGKITLRTSRNWFLSIFSLTQGESKNWRSSRRSRTSATKNILQKIWGSWKSRTSATKKIWQNVRRLKVTSWVGAQGSTSITGNARVVLIEASLPKIRESLLEGSNESLLKAIVWTKYCLIVV